MEARGLPVSPAGMDYRDWEAGEKYSRTDSMMLLTYDPITKYAGMLFHSA